MSRKLTPKEGDYYGRNLPHWQSENAVLFMTVRLYGSLPRAKIEELKERKAAEEQLLRAKGLTDEALKRELYKCLSLIHI